MATFQDLEAEWSMLSREDPHFWTNSDLQLAAELGKTLLERNKELENALKQSQSMVEDQLQEIEYLTKQSNALREVNDSRLRIYEQLEISIQDLERANHRLALENSAERKRSKTLATTIEQLEAKNDELLANLDDLKLQLDLLRKKDSRKNYEHVNTCTSPLGPIKPIEIIAKTPKPQPVSVAPKEKKTDEMEEMTQLMGQLREMKAQLGKEQRKVGELEEQLATVLRQNQVLENQIIKLHHNDEDAKSVHDELMILEEVRQGQLCNKCLGNIESRDIPEDESSYLGDFMNRSSDYNSSYSPDTQEYPQSSSPIQKRMKNQYKELVEKYESLFEDQPNKNAMSLQDELRLSGEYNRNEEGKKHVKKLSCHTPTTDFSEAETSSSGFADETSSKHTQTEGTFGSILWALADEEHITEDSCPIEAHFQKRPQYRELFKEIFAVLKKTAENKEEGRDIVSLNETNGIKQDLNETLTHYPDIADDTESVVSSTVSVPASVPEQADPVENNVEAQKQVPENDQPLLKPLIRQMFDNPTKENNKKRSSRKKHRRNESPHIIGATTISYTSRPNSGRRRRELRNNGDDWNSLQINRCRSKDPSPAPSVSSEKAYEFRPSLASQEMKKLKGLERSYAEVLKLGEGRKREQRQRGKYSDTNHW